MGARACGHVNDRVFVRFTAFSFRFGIFVPITNERRIKLKFAEKLQNACMCKKKAVPLQRRLVYYVYGERSPIKQPSAGDLSF